MKINLSVIIPVYEAQKTLQRTINSINNQLISDTNTVKEEQSKNELFVWSYEHTENSNADTRNKTANVQSVIKNQSGFD